MFVIKGGRVVLSAVKQPAKSEWQSGLEGLQDALALERDVNASLLSLHGLANKHEDAHLADFLEEHFLDEQVEAIKELGDLITKAKRAGPGLGEYLFDKDIKS
jgi:ferritin heavy chain